MDDIDIEDLDRSLTDCERFLALGLTEIALFRGAQSRSKTAVIEEFVDLFELTERKFDLMRPTEQFKTLRSARQEARHAFESRFEVISDRLSSVTRKLKLCPMAVQVLTVANLVHGSSALGLISQAVSVSSLSDIAQVLSKLLGGQEVRWRTVIGVAGALCESGLRERARTFGCLKDFLQAFVDLREMLDGTAPVEQCLIETAVTPMPAPTLTVADFQYLGEHLAVLHGLLRQPDSSAQILLAGAPGTGKTQLAVALAQATKRKCFAIETRDRDGEAADRTARMSHYYRAQRLTLKPDQSLLVFDEIEDVFDGEHWAEYSGNRQRYKGWTNRMLESPLVPTVWITNDLSRIDPAFLRRFDHVVQMRSPPRGVRRQLLEKTLGVQGVSTDLLDRAAESEDLSPADVDRCARLLPGIFQRDPGSASSSCEPHARDNPSALEARHSLDELAACVLSARPGSIVRSRLRARPANALVPYQTQWINCDQDVDRLIDGLRQRGRGTLGFFGPPGTGKTELARHMARQLDRPLMLKRASDLLSPWHGETEARIAKAFETALDEEAVLLIDEADSFLQDRSAANYSWQLSQVNEMLAQLDGFGGVAILTSNLVTSLDRALLRRIDVKLSFDYLKYEHAQAVGRLLTTDPQCTDPGAGENLQRAMFPSWQSLDLSFGDFAAAGRKLELCGEARSVPNVERAVCQEVLARNGAGRPIGFVSGG